MGKQVRAVTGISNFNAMMAVFTSTLKLADFITKTLSCFYNR